MDKKEKKIRVGWVQIGEGFGDQYYLPYSVGLLAGYAAQYLGNKERYRFLPALYRPLPLAQSLGRLEGADIVFFSTYLWNLQRSLKLAREVKKRSPAILIVFGGPQVPEKAPELEAFLRRNPFIDLGCAGEGEIATLRILEHFEDRHWDLVPSVGYLASGGHCAINPRAARISDLNAIPSPYLNGVFDELMRQDPGVSWQAMWETNRGCPFTCAFCAWGSGEKKGVYHYGMDRLNAEIDWFSERKIEFMFCCDANYGMFDRDREIARRVAENKRRFGYPKAFSVQNTKNSSRKIFEIQKILNDAGLQKGVNLALQSLNRDTLRHIGRSNISNKTYGELQRLFANHNIPTFTDLIIGLPGETYESFVQGVSDLIASGQHNRIKFINLTILENTLMAEADFQKKHGLVLKETALIPHHSSLHGDENILEKQQLVIATQAMPEEDWIKTWVFSWMASLLHFGKLLQIPFILLHGIYGISYKALFETFMKERDDQSLFSRILAIFKEKAVSIREGGSEYMMSEKWLNMAWYPDEWMLIDIVAEAGLEAFYREAEERVLSLAREAPVEIEPAMISQAIRLNRALMKQPFFTEDIVVRSDYNLWEIFQAALRGEEARLEKGNFAYLVDRTTQSWTSWEEWCREVIWYGNKRGDYIYSVRRNVS